MLKYNFYLTQKLKHMRQKTSKAFIVASWAAMAIGLFGYFIGLFRATMELNEKGYYFTIIMFGLFGAISLQKSVRDRLEGLKVTDIYFNICWFATLLSIGLLVIGLWNATLLPSEKGFYGFGFILALYGALAVQKNTRDDIAADKKEETEEEKANFLALDTY